MIAIVEDEGGDPSWVPERPQEAVLVMVNKRLLDADALFSFSRMRLLRLADECRRQQVAMSVIPIAYAT